MSWGRSNFGYGRSSFGYDSGAWKLWGTIVVIVLFLGVDCAYVFGTQATVKFKVKKLTNKRTNDTDKWIIMTQGGETFENTDSMFRLKCNSTDVQAKLDEGKCYKADVYGWRMQACSGYRNVVSVTEIPCSEMGETEDKKKSKD